VASPSPCSTIMTTANTALILTRLESGFRANAASLNALENDLAATMTLAREAGSRVAPSRSWNSAWHRGWDEVLGCIRAINRHLVEIGERVTGQDANRIDSALVIWEAVQLEDAKLLVALRGVRMQAGELAAPSRKEWNQLARVIESHLETIHTSAQALRVKLEYLKKYSADEVEELVEGMRTRLRTQPRSNQLPAEPFDRDYRNAVLEREEDQHVFTGFMDVIKALSLWVESPDERMRKNRSLTLDDT
jgi:hypothetical protein